MMKAASLPLALSLFLATAAVSYAQAPATETAVNEAVIRQANRIALRQKLGDALGAQTRHDLPTAAKLYDDSWELVQKIGYVNVEPEADQARAGLAAVRLELAREAQRASNYKAAALHINDVLRVDPSNAAALELKRANEQLLAEQKGRIPDDETLSMVPSIQKDRIDANTKVQTARCFGRWGRSTRPRKCFSKRSKTIPKIRPGIIT